MEVSRLKPATGGLTPTHSCDRITACLNLANAVAIVHRHFVEGKPELEAYLVEELERILIGNQIYDLRTKSGMTQAALARKVGLKAADIDQLENADYEGHPLPTLRKIANVFGMRIELNFVPITKEKSKRGKS